MLTQNYNVLPC